MKYLKKICATGLIMTAVNTLPALAEQPSYRYVAVGYNHVNIGDDDLGSADGLLFNANFDLAKNVFVRAGTANAEGSADYYGYDLDFEQTMTNFGLGFKTALSETASFYGVVDLLRIDVDSTFDSESESDKDTGNAIEIGVRNMMSNQFELSANIARLDAFDDTQTQLGIGATFLLGQSAGVSLNLARDDASDVTTSFELRALF